MKPVDILVVRVDILMIRVDVLMIIGYLNNIMFTY